MDADSIIEWLEERRQNCLRISRLAGCDDVAEWISDARYFEGAIKLAQQAKEVSDAHLRP